MFDAKRPFQGIEDVDVYGSGKYLTPGRYDLQIQEISYFASKKHAGRYYFKVQCDILECEADGNQAGTQVSWLVNLMHGDTAQSNIKQFACSLIPGMTKDDVTEQHMMELCQADQPARGITVSAEAWHEKTSSGGDFTKVRWIQPAPPPAAEPAAPAATH